MTSRVVVNQSDILALNVALSGIKNGATRVLTTSVNKSIKTTQTQAVKLIGQELNLKASRIKKDFKQNKANFTNPLGSLDATGKPVGLINFQARQLKTGVSHKVLKSSARSTTPGAFIKSIAVKGAPEDPRHVFDRQYQGPKKPLMPGKKYGALPRIYRLPISRLTGPRVEDIYSRPAVYDKVQQVAVDALADNVSRETDSLLRRFG